MAKVYDPAQQATIDVPAAEATAGIRAGKYLATGRVRITRADGELGSIDAAELPKALDSGFRLVDDDEVDTIRTRREVETTGSLIKGTAEAATAGATLGLSTLIASQYNDPEAMAARREALGTLGTVAEIGGAVAPALLTGGSTAAVRGGGLAAKALAATPSGLAARLGARAGEGLAARMGTGAASKIVPVAGREFIEGAAQGMGAQIDEDVLGNRELAADRIAASGLMGGLFGVGAAVGVHGLAKVASGTVRAPIDGVRGVLGRSNAASGGMATREVAEAAAGSGLRTRVEATMARAQERNAVLQGVDPETAARVSRMVETDEGTVDILRLERDRPKIERQAAELVTDRVNSVHASMNEARRLANGESKATYWERLGPKNERDILLEGDRAQVVERRLVAERETDSLYMSHRNELTKLAEENKYAMREFGGGAPYNASVMYQAHNALARFERELVEARNLSGREVSTKVAMAADRYKRELGGIIEDAGGWGDARHVDPDVQSLNKVLRQRYAEVRDHLERRDLWGAAAEAQADINAAYVKYANADAAYKDATAGTGLGTIVNPDGTINGFKAIKLVRAHGRTGGDVAVERLMDALEARVAYFEKISKHVEFDDAGKKAFAKVRSDVDDLRREFKRQAVDAGKLDDLLEWRRVESSGSPSIGATATSTASLLGGIVGGALGGPVGAGIGAIAGGLATAARQPYTTLHRYAAIRSALNKADIRLDGVVSKMFGKAGEIRAPKLPRLPIGTVAGQLSRKEHDARREKAIEKATDYLGSSEALAQALAVPLYDVPPGISSTIQQQAQVAASFLQAKAPKVYKRGKTKLVDPVSSASFARYLEAVADPIGALERFDTGRITAETAEAIRVVYPALFLDLQERIQTEMARAQDEGREIPYDKRIRYGQLFATTTDPSLVASTAAEMQLAIGSEFDEPTAAEVMAAGKTQKPGKLEPGGGDSMQTAGDRSANWRM